MNLVKLKFEGCEYGRVCVSAWLVYSIVHCPSTSSFIFCFQRRKKILKKCSGDRVIDSCGADDDYKIIINVLRILGLQMETYRIEFLSSLSIVIFLFGDHLSNLLIL